jgi:hypothetical protein
MQKYFVNADSTNPSKDELEQILSEYRGLESDYSSSAVRTKSYKLDAFWKKMETASDDTVVKFLNNRNNQKPFNYWFSEYFEKYNKKSNT